MSKLESTTQYSRFTPQKIFFLLLTLLFVIAPFYYQPNFGGEGLYLPYNSSVWFVAVWIIATGAILLSRSHLLVLPKYWLGIACLPIGALLTGFVVDTSNPTEWLTRLSVILGGYFFFLSLFQFQLSPKHVEQGLYIILAMGMVAAAYAIFQIHNFTHLYSFIPRSNGIPVGIFQQINLQASLMATLLVLVYYLISRPMLNSMSWFIRLVLCITAFTASYVIASSGSRVGLLGALLGVTLLVLGRWNLLKINKKTFIFIILSTILGASLQTSGLLKSAAKFDRAIGGMEADIRWKVYKISWETFLEKPLLGHGLGSFQKVFQEKRKEYQQEDILHLNNAPRFSHPHNELFFWLVEGGMLSITGILIAAGATLIQLVRSGWQRGSAYAALLIPITLHTQVELPFYISNTHWLLLLFLLFLTHQHKRKSVSAQGLSLAANRLIPITFISIAILSSYILVQAQIANAHLVKYLASRSTQAQHLEVSLNSFYFREHARYLKYRHNMIEGLKNQEAKPIIELINYTEHLVKTTPAVNYYIELINAYNVLGQPELRDQRLQEALGIYESNKQLLYIKQRIKLRESSQVKEDKPKGQNLEE
ncbi:MAG: O-antigen ligase C-terminal domain-containing protein [Neptuniibacter sp.]